jgi:biotin carboxylase
VQLLIGARGVLVNEAACRIGGAFEDSTIPYATGFDMLGAVIRAALGQPFDNSALHQPRVAEAGLQLSVQMLFVKPGAVTAVTPLASVLALPGVLSAGYNFGVGSVMPAMENATARFGHCVLATRDGDMDTRVNALYGLLRVTGAQGEALLIRRTNNGEEMI